MSVITERIYNYEIGMIVTGSGIQADSQILTIDSASQITLDKNATATASTVALTCTNRTARGDGTIGDNVGTKQTDEFESHTHEIPSAINEGGGNKLQEGTSEVSAHLTTATGGNETRPTNIYVMYCIKY